MKDLNKQFSLILLYARLFQGLYAVEIEFNADKTLLDSKKEILELEGNVSLKYQALIFEADKIFLDKKNDMFSGDELKFSSLDNFFYGAANIVEISKTKLTLKEVEFSTCPCEEKIWWIESDEIILNNEEKIVSSKNSKIVVQGKTLAYLKKANFPISSERKSGILLPEIAINERSGLDIKIPVYVNLKENLDLTIEPRVMTQRGYGVTNELRYLGKNYTGFFNSSFLQDDKKSFQVLETDNLRWSYNFLHEQKLSESLFLKTNTSSTSDPFYLSDLGGFMSGLSRTLYLPQQASFSFFEKNLSMRFDLNSFKLTNPLAANQFQRLPGLKLNYFFNKNNFNFLLNSDLAYFRKGGSFRNDEKESLSRFFLKPKVSYLFNQKNYFLESSISLRYQFHNYQGNKDTEHSPLFELNNSLKFTKLSKTSRIIFEPYINLAYSDQKKIINKLKIDSGLRFNPFKHKQQFGNLFLSNQKDVVIGTKLTYSDKISNLLKFQIAKLSSLGQKILFFEEKRIDLPEPFSLKLKYKTNNGIIFKSHLSIDRKNVFNISSNSLSLNFNKYKILIGHYFARNIEIYNLNNNSLEQKKINSFEFSADVYLDKNWSGGFKFINDLEQKKNINSVVSIDYENKGMTVGLAYMKSLELDWVSILENDTFKDYHKDRFRLFFELKGLGSIGRPKESYLKRRNL
jgi:lipopolysaccharide assembly outer membrane protein LptD (OstA)